MPPADPSPVGADAPELPRLTLGARMRWAWTRARLGSRLTIEGRAAAGPRVRIAVAPGASVTLGDGVELGDATRIEAVGGPFVSAPALASASAAPWPRQPLSRSEAAARSATTSCSRTRIRAST